MHIHEHFRAGLPVNALELINRVASSEDVGNGHHRAIFGAASFDVRYSVETIDYIALIID